MSAPTPPLHGKFYWVRPYSKTDPFEPAQCRDRFGNGVLYFCFTNGSVMQVDPKMEYMEAIPPTQ